ncbi:MAG: membrane protein insertion efficiency factor YidD [Candidatus Yanofskybacteria bacterium]|nr:membrane protein insertion efficiency factor YidD [Candidatus Yanofskybacteria bacterium]
MKKITISFIKFYQYLSRSVFRNAQLPVLVYAGCKFQPTCSEYAIEVISKYGFIKGLIKAVFRILKCNPLSRGGIDNP